MRAIGKIAFLGITIGAGAILTCLVAVALIDKALGGIDDCGIEL